VERNKNPKIPKSCRDLVHIAGLGVWEAGGRFEHEQRPNVIVVQSTWRQIKKGRIKVGDLRPVKDVKGGGGVTGTSKPITGRTDTTGSQLIQKGHYRGPS
jgi:hypothetical protein